MRGGDRNAMPAVRHRQKASRVYADIVAGEHIVVAVRRDAIAAAVADHEVEELRAGRTLTVADATGAGIGQVEAAAAIAVNRRVVAVDCERGSQLGQRAVDDGDRRHADIDGVLTHACISECDRRTQGAMTGVAVRSTVVGDAGGLSGIGADVHVEDIRARRHRHRTEQNAKQPLHTAEHSSIPVIAHISGSWRFHGFCMLLKLAYESTAPLNSHDELQLERTGSRASTPYFNPYDGYGQLVAFDIEREAPFGAPPFDMTGVQLLAVEAVTEDQIVRSSHDLHLNRRHAVAALVVHDRSRQHN